MSRRYEKTVESVYNKVEITSEQVTQLTRHIVNKICNQLDTRMLDIRDRLEKGTDNISNEELEDYIIGLASDLYFCGSQQEDLGAKEDICKAIRQEVYNNERNNITGTVTDKDTKATAKIKTESIVLTVYSRSYKQVKFKVDAGYEMLNSLKKLMNRRVSELELSNSRYISNRRNND